MKNSKAKKNTITSLVTGGAGFIGSHVTDELLKLGHRVVALDDLSGGFIENVNPKAVFIKGSVNDEKLLKNLFQKYQFNNVYHLAAYAAEGLSHFIRKFNYQNNLLGSINLINLAVNNNVAHFVFTSSIAVYGSNQTPMVETLTPHPEDPYGISKYAIELDLQAAHEMFGLNYTIFRPHNVYGERQNHGDPYRNVLGIFINNLMRSKPMTVFGDGLQTRAFTHVSDVAPYLANCINVNKAKNQIFNIGADKPYTILELAKAIAQAMDLDVNLDSVIKHLPARNEVINAYSDHTKAKRTFGINDTMDLKTGIDLMVRWSKSVGPRDPKPFGSIEISKNLPPSWQSLISK